MKTIPIWPFILSFLIHSAGLLPMLSRTEHKASQSPPLLARLIPVMKESVAAIQKIEVDPVDEVSEPLKQSPQVVKRPHHVKKLDRIVSWQEHVSNHLVSLERKHMLYPKDAIRDGIEGVVIVFIVLDDNGKVIAVRIDSSSGHDILDQAALRSMRIIKPLPPEAPREFSLPVGFRIRD